MVPLTEGGGWSGFVGEEETAASSIKETSVNSIFVKAGGKVVS